MLNDAMIVLNQRLFNFIFLPLIQVSQQFLLQGLRLLNLIVYMLKGFILFMYLTVQL